MFLAYEEECLQQHLEGVFQDEQMAKKWMSEKEGRFLVPTKLLDKTFLQLAVEYNTTYEQ